MNKTMLSFLLSGTVLIGSLSEAAPIPAELAMGEGRTWKGELLNRDGEWVEFKSSTSAKPLRLPADKITQLTFEVSIDKDKVARLMDDLEYETIIESLKRTIKPFAEYSDIPSNLTRYNYLLMELYYRTAQYQKSLEISSRIAEEAGNPVLQEKSRVFQALALIESGKSAEAEALLTKYGWDKDISDDTPPATLYITAKLMSLKGQYTEAMQFVAKVIAFNSQDPEWMQPAEMLCAELYTELKMYDSAEEVCREIMLLYKNTEEYEKAQQLQIKIEKMRAEQKLVDSLESEEA